MKVGDTVYTAKDVGNVKPVINPYKIFAIGENHVLAKHGRDVNVEWGFKRLHKRDFFLRKKDALEAYATKRVQPGDLVTAVETRYSPQKLIQGLVVEVKRNLSIMMLNTDGVLMHVYKGCYTIFQRGETN
tara:strand:+ start:317 stop:706 length:390 start_codon:yes stop_codon:yes gene_type:complete